MALTVTATQQGGNTFAGMGLRVLVLTGAKGAASQTGASAVSNAGVSVGITTTQTGSVVAGAVSLGNSSGAPVAEAGTTLKDSFDDTGNGQYYVTFTTGATGTPGAATVGLSSPASPGAPGIAAAEILASGTIAVDASTPAFATTSPAVTVTTASFSPPSGSLLVALVPTDGGVASSGASMAITDTAGLTWHQLAQTSTAAATNSSVWAADAPGPPSATPQPVVAPSPAAIQAACW